MVQNQSQNFTTIFLIQYFCLHAILPFSKSYPEIDQLQSAGKEMSDTWYCIVICARLCVSFLSKSKATNAFPKHLLKSKECDNSIQASEKVFSHDSKELSVQWFV